MPSPPRLTAQIDLTNTMMPAFELIAKIAAEEAIAQFKNEQPSLKATPEFLTKQEAAEMLKMSVASLDKLRKSKDILTAYIGNTPRIPLTEITKYLDNLR